MRPSTHHVAAPDSIAHLDGVGDSETCDQNSHPPILQQQPLDSSAILQMAPPETAKQARVTNVDGGLQEHMHLDPRNSPQKVQEAQVLDERQYEDTTQLFPSHKIDVQTSEPLLEHLHAVNPIQMPSGPHVATGEIKVKPEPTIDDRDLFETFTNEDLHNEEDAETKQAPSDVNGPVDQVPIRKISSVSWRAHWTRRNVRTTHHQQLDTYVRECLKGTTTPEQWKKFVQEVKALEKVLKK